MSAANIEEFKALPDMTEPELRKFCKTGGLDFNDVDVGSLSFSAVTSSGEKTTYECLQKSFSEDAVPADPFPLTFVVSFSLKAHTLPP